MCFLLKTQLEIKQVGTCSGLTAGRTLKAHENALEQLNSFLGVYISKSVAEFVKWISEKWSSSQDQFFLPLSYLHSENKVSQLKIKENIEGLVDDKVGKMTVKFTEEDYILIE